MKADAATLERAWFEAEGLSRIPDLVRHPDDDMQRADVLQIAPEKLGVFYARSGHEALVVLRHALAAAGRELAQVESLLDFAGGYGRVTRYLARELGPEKVWVSDILAPAVAFARERFGVHAFDSAWDIAEVPFPRRYSVIWVASLFTHLPRPQFGPFLRGLHDALEPDGLLLFTTHNMDVLEPHERDPSGYAFVAESESRVLDKNAYGSTYVTPELVRSIAREHGVEHLWHLPHELWRIQDLFAVARRDIPSMAGWRATPLARGAIEKAVLSADGHAWIGGWVRVPRGESVTRIELRLDSGASLDALHAPLGERLPEREGGAAFEQTNWYIEGPAAGVLSPDSLVAAVAHTAGGERTCFDVAAINNGGTG